MSKLIIGLTGGIGSGKTTVTNIFAELGIDIIDADIVARLVVEPGSKALDKIEKYFGTDFITQQGQLDRPKLRSRIFSSTTDKDWLNSLLHPIIRQTILQQIDQAKSCYCILVAPLLLENQLNKLVNRVLVVDVDESTQITRTIARDTSSREEVQRIIASQMSREQRLKHADDIICNRDTDLETVRKKVLKLDHHYRSLSKSQSE